MKSENIIYVQRPDQLAECLAEISSATLLGLDTVLC
jgi:hypothetical protein